MRASFLVLLLIVEAMSQQPQSPSPMVENTRPHPRITQSDAKGRRVELKSLNGAVLFINARVNPQSPVPLLIHFHGAPWLIQQHVAEHLPKAALITVQLGGAASK